MLATCLNFAGALGSGQLIPTEPRAPAKFKQVASIEYAQFDPIVSGIIWEKVLKRYTGEATNEERVDEVPVGTTAGK
jgi:hypothetical protein